MQLTGFNKVICLFIACFFFMMIEGITRLVVPQTRLDKIIFILIQDPILFWRQKPNLKIKFQGVRVQTDRYGLRNNKCDKSTSAHTLRIICMGASPTFGWGVPYEDIYSCQLEKRLRNNFGNQVKVINAGVIGYSSYQGLFFLKRELIKLHPDLITVSYVLNDLDRYRFYRSNRKPDKELQPRSRILIAVKNIFDRSSLVELFERSMVRWITTISIFFSSTDIIDYPNNVRVSPEDYEHNLQAIIDFAQQKEVKVVLIKMPVNLPIPEKISEFAKLKADNFLSEGLSFLKLRKYNQAINQFKEAITHNPYLSEAYYYLGICFEKKGMIKQAQIYFQEQKRAEAYRCGKDGIIYNKIMTEVAYKNQIPLVDVVSAFHKEENKYLYINPQYDPIHPNSQGHKIISYEIYNMLVKKELLKTAK